MNFEYCPSCGQRSTVEKQDNTNYECRNCHWHFWNNAKTAVAVVIIKDGKLLVSKRAEEPHKGMYDLPGGFVEFGEDPYDAAIREVIEETSLHAERKNLELIAIYYNHYNDSVFTNDPVFLLKDWSGTPAAGDDSAALEWKSFDFINDPTFEEPYTGLDKILQARLDANTL